MFKNQNVQLTPNLLSRIVEEDQSFRTSKRPLLKDATNIRNRECKFIKQGQCRGDSASLPFPQKEDETLGMRREDQTMKQNQSCVTSKLNNLLISFDFDESIQEQKQQPVAETNQIQQSTLPKQSNKTISQKLVSQKSSTISLKNNFLLDFQSELWEQPSLKQYQKVLPKIQFSPAAQKQQIKQQTPQKVEHSQQKITVHLKVPSKGQIILNLQSEDEEQQSEKVEEVSSIDSKDIAQNIRMVIRHAGLISRFSSNYYLQSIPKGAVFESTIKRDRRESQVKYHLFDNVTQHNFMTVVKDSKGYIVISKFEQRLSSNNIQARETVVGRIVSNFFGTEFNCSLQNTPYTKGQSYALKSNAQNVITIEYEINIFGLNGPRKIAAYIPKQLPSTQNLNEIYAKENKKSLTSTVLKFHNKAPQWCKESNAHVLNFRGRATISSIKNFIMVKDGGQSNDSASQKIVFGKIGRDLFNLDIKCPFSILQGVVLAISSFDRKLACE